jgi:UDP-N-acetylglucosamine 3-dehydrogenase
MSPRECPPHLAILGCGAIAAQHARTIRRVDPAVQLGFASRDAGRAERMKRDHGGVVAWGSYQAALEDRRVDVVLIATPPAFHLDLTLRALKAGHHVIVEKPAFLRAADVDLVAAAAAASGRHVLVAENYCYKPLAGLLQMVVTSGELGDVLFVDVRALKHVARDDWRNDPTLTGDGALFEGGVHWIDLMANLGLTVEAVQGLRPGQLEGLERSTLVVLQYEEGAVGTLHHSWQVPARLRGLQSSRIAGTRGSLTFESNGLFATLHARRNRWFMPGLRDIGGFRAMFTDFLAVLRTDCAPRMTLERARADLALVEAAYECTP